MRKIRAQVISEYIMIMLLAVVALASMQLYFQRAIKSMVRTSADEYGSQDEALRPKWSSLSKSASTVGRAQSQSETTSIARSVSGDQRITQRSDNSWVVPLESGGESFSTQETWDDK